MICVVVPELEALLRETRARPVLLKQLLSRAQSRALSGDSPIAELLTGQVIPAAAISRLLDGGPEDAAGAVWMRADPVTLVPDLNAVWVGAASGLASDHPALPELIELFSDAGLSYEIAIPQRAYLRLERLPDCRFSPPWTLAGRSLDDALPEGPDAALWRRLLSDAQVILHQYLDRSEVGGLWFWGPGTLPSRTSLQARVSHVASADSEVLRLADWLGLSHEPVDAPTAVADGSLACWSPDPARSADDNLLALTGWLKPIWRRLRSGGIDRLELAGRERVWQISPLQAWRFWRRHSEWPA